jgi:hypothetical protein
MTYRTNNNRFAIAVLVAFDRLVHFSWGWMAAVTRREPLGEYEIERWLEEKRQEDHE